MNTYGYVRNNPLRYADPSGLNPIAGAIEGAELGTVTCGPYCGIAGAIIGGVIGATAGDYIYNAKPPENAYDQNGPKAPGKPGETEGFRDPKGGENWVPNPNPRNGGSSHGWEDDKGRVWCPTGQGGRSHGGPHWDVQKPGGYDNVFPVRYGS